MMQVFTTLCANGDQASAGEGRGEGSWSSPSYLCFVGLARTQQVAGVRGRACVEVLVGLDVRDFDLFIFFFFFSIFVMWIHF